VQVAYKRAWQEMESMFGPFSRAEWDQLRRARWQAMEGRDFCSQAEPEALLPPETIAKLNRTQPLGQALAVELIAKYPHTADELVPERDEYYPTVGVLLEDLTERYAWKYKDDWRVSEPGFIPLDERRSIMRDHNAPQVIRWREVVDWEAERDPEATRRAHLLAKYPHDANVELPTKENEPVNLSITAWARNLGVLFSDYTEGYAWRGGIDWHVFDRTVPKDWDQIGPGDYAKELGKTIIRWREISDWAAEKADHDRQSA
jgi:hypothetical protein